MDASDSQRPNAFSPIKVTEEGSIIDSIFLQPEKAEYPTDVMFDVIFIVSKTVNPKNAYWSTEDTPSWISMCLTCFANRDQGEEE